MARKSLDGVSVINNSLSTFTNSDCKDINHLLFLETLLRNKEHEANLRSQAEEKARLYQEAHAEYRYYYERYVLHFESSTTRKILELDSKVTTDQLDQLQSALFLINRKINKDDSVGFLTPEIVEHCQEAIRALPNYNRISQIQDETIKMKSAVDAIQSLNTSIEEKLELVSARSIDFYVERMQSKHMEKEFSNQFDE